MAERQHATQSCAQCGGTGKIQYRTLGDLEPTKFTEDATIQNMGGFGTRACSCVKDLPAKPLGYVVLDHGIPAGSMVRGEDAQGRVYVQVSPALLDECAHAKGEARGLLALASVPVYNRPALPDAWPDA